MSFRQIIEPNPRYSRGVRAGNTIYVSGQIATDENGKLVGEGNSEAQADQCFKNAERILKAAGATLDDVVIIRAFLLKQSDYAGYASSKVKFFKSPPPGGTAVIVAGLLVPGAMLEVEVTAVIEK